MTGNHLKITTLRRLAAALLVLCLVTGSLPADYRSRALSEEALATATDLAPIENVETDGDPEAAAPDAVTPEEAEPAEAEPEEAEPEETEPAAADPAEADPAETEPEESDPVEPVVPDEAEEDSAEEVSEEEAEETPAEETPEAGEEVPEEETEETPAEETPEEAEEEVPEEAEETPVDEIPEETEETPVEETPVVEDIPEETEETPVEEIPEETEEEIPAEETEETPAAEEVPETAETPEAEEVPEETKEEIPVEETPVVEEVPEVIETPVEEAPVAETVPEAAETPVEAAPAAEAVPETVETPVETAPAAEPVPEVVETPVEAAPAAEAASEVVETPVETAPVAETVPETAETPAEETPAEETPVEETPAEETPAEATPAEEPSLEETTETLTERTVTTQADHYLISVSGPMPESATIQAAEIPQEAAARMTEREILFAYDVRLIVDGQVWQPEQHGVKVKVTVQDLGGNMEEMDVDVLHVKTDFLDAEGNLSDSAVEQALQDLPEGAVETEMINTATEEGTVTFGVSSFSGLVASPISTLESLFRKAISDVTLNQRVQITLKQGTTYAGDSIFSVGDRKVEDGFEVEISASDAGTDGMSGDGSTMITGNLTIRGIKVIMNSIIFDPDKIVTVKNRHDSAKAEYRDQGGELIINGSKLFPNEMTVVIGNNSKLTFNTTDDDDVLNFEMTQGADSVTVTTGEGVDAINGVISDGKVNIQTGFGDDRITLNIAGRIDELVVDAGDSADTINIIDNGSAPQREIEVDKIDPTTGQPVIDPTTGQPVKEKKLVDGIEINGGTGDDIFTIDVRDNAGTMTVDTGEGGDTVSVTKGDHFTSESVDYDRYIAPNGENPNPATEAVVRIKSADRSDRITVDASTALAIKGIEITPTTDKGDGASVFLKGSLAATGGNPMGWIDPADHSKGFRINTTLEAGNDNWYSLDISLGNNHFTDALLNKNRVEIFNDETGDFVYDKATEDFTDYVLRKKVNGLDSITVTGSDTPLMLSNIVLDSDETKDQEDHIKIHNLTAKNLNLLAKGATITFDGTVEAQNIRAESALGTLNVIKNLMDITKQDFGDTLANMFSVKDSAIINVNKGANLTAAQDIALVTRVKHRGGMLTFLPADINLVNVKIADAKVNIAEGATMTAKGGNVTAEARIKTLTGYEFDEAENKEKAVKDGMPIAVTVIVNDASVTVDKGAEITSGADTAFDIASDIKAATYANSSANLPSPVDIAVTVISSDLKGRIDGKVTAGRKVQMYALGEIKDENVATGAAQQGALGGAFVAVNVVDQDVDVVIGSSAEVRAGGDVRLASRGTANITTKAISGSANMEDSSGASLEGALKKFGGVLLRVLVEQGKGKYFNETTEKKMEKMLKSISGGDYSVKVIKTSDINDEKGSATVTTRTNDDGKVQVLVNPEAKSGCTVKRVRYRFLKPGEDHYTYVEVKADVQDQDTYAFILPDADTEVLVDYEGQPDGKDAEKPEKEKKQEEEGDDSFYNIAGLFNDAKDAAGGSAEEDDDLFSFDADEFEVRTNYKLAFGAMEHGSVVTWLTTDDGKNLEEIYATEKLLLVPNPALVELTTSATQKFKMKENSLTVSYEVTEDGKTVTKKETVTKDKQGRYVFTVPDNLAKGTTFTVTAEFEEDKTTVASEPSHDSLTGAIAVGVLNNKSHQWIEAGSTVIAGGAIELWGFKLNRNYITADGTNVEAGGSSKKKADKPKPVVHTSYGVSGADFAVRVNSNVAGAVEATVDGQKISGASPYKPFFTLTKENASKVQQIVVSFYSKFESPVDTLAGRGLRRTATITRVVKENGEVTYEVDKAGFAYSPLENVTINASEEILELNTTGLAVTNGSTVDISFIFAEDPAKEQQSSSEYLVSNPIMVSYNGLKDKDVDISMGTVKYDGNHRTSGKYYFRVEPDRDHGYTIEAYDPNDQTGTKSNTEVLYASWTGADGRIHKAPLSRDETSGPNIWCFNPTGGGLAIPDGAVITVNAVFKEDLRKVEQAADYKPKDGHGSASFDKSEAKKGDKVEITLKPDTGYVASKVIVKWYSDTRGWETKEYDVTNQEKGTVTIEMPQTAEGGSNPVSITPVFAKKDVTVKLMSDDIALSQADNKGWKGGNMTVSPVKEKAEAGYKVTSVKLVTKESHPRTFSADGDTIKIPSDLNCSEVEISATLARKSVRISEGGDLNGKVVPTSAYADPGDKVYVQVKPEEGYRIKGGTIKAQVRTGAESSQIILTKEKDGRYSFTLPSGADKNSVVSLACEFEPGSEGKDFSLGASLAIGVTKSENESIIKGGTVSAANGYSIIALTVAGKSIMDSKAGYSSGDTGLAGAFTIQVTTLDTEASIRKDDNGSITLKKGSVFMLSKGKQDFKAIADASNKKEAEAKGTGVGAGLVVDVTNLKARGEIQDGVKLVAYKDKDGNVSLPVFSGVNINVGQKYKKEITAKAGAIGGSAFVPVAAIDVHSTDVISRFGKMDMTGVKAAVQANLDKALEAAAEQVFETYVQEAVQAGMPRARAEEIMLQKAGGKKTNLLTEKQREEIYNTKLTDDEKLYYEGYLPVKGKVKLKSAAASAKAEYNHVIVADASTRGDSTALGGAFIVTWLSDNAKSLLNQSLNTTKAVTLSSTATNMLKATAKAAVAGGAGEETDSKGKGGADKQADKMLGGAGSIAGKYGGMDAGKIQNDSKGRQQAETAENTVSVAGAFALNIMKNKNRSEILDGVNLVSGGKLEILSYNRTDGTIRADASATKSNTGVGVGIAINIVTMENIARIGTGMIQATELDMEAIIAKAPGRRAIYKEIKSTTQLRTDIATEIVNAISSSIPEKYRKLGELDWTKLIGDFAGTAAGKLMEDLGLDTLVSLSSGDGIVSGLEEAGKVMLDRIVGFFESEVAPYAEVFADIMETGENMENGEWWKTTLFDLLKTCTAEVGGDVWQTVTKNLFMKGGSALLGSALNMLTDRLSGKGFDATELKKNLKKAFADALGPLKDQIIDTLINKMSDRVPLVKAANIQRIEELKKALSEKTSEQFLEDLGGDLLRTFREQVYDYEKYLVKYFNGDFVDNLKNELISILKESTVTVTNELLEQLASTAGVRFEKEAKDDRHVITTQAISGAGGKEKSGAGSLAIAWVNLTTKAEIADSDQGITVTKDGAMLVHAEELRRIRTHATAAVDANGDTKNNEGKGAKEDAETGGNSEAQNSSSYKNITVNTNGGGTVRYVTGDSTDDFKIILDPKAGYQLKEGDWITYSFKDKNGENEEEATVQIKKENGNFCIRPLNTVLDPNKSYNTVDPWELKINIEIDFEEVLHGIEAPKSKDADNGGKPLAEGAVTVAVEGREVKNNKLFARVGETVQITVDHQKSKGHKVKGIEIQYLAMENGKMVNKKDTLTTAILETTSNENETVYVYKMPNYELYDITVIFENDTEEHKAQNAAKDADGDSIGVGAAVAFSYGNSDVQAIIGRRGAGVTAGTLVVRSLLQHKQENYSTAGTDPFEGTDGDLEKDKGYDASVSVFIVDNDVLAKIAEGTVVTTTADKDADFAPSFTVNKNLDNVETGNAQIKVTSGALVVQSSETGATETKASAFATGSKTAVGASVAVNVSLSDIMTEMNGNASVTGDVAIVSDSYSEDVTWSFASAMGADVQRALNKFSDLKDKGSDAINKLTTGKYFDDLAKKKDKKATGTSKRITERLNDDRVKAEDGDEASENLSVSSNVLRSQGSKLDTGDDANDASKEAGKEANGAKNDDGAQNAGGGVDINPRGTGAKDSEKLQVAATVGVTVALHRAEVAVGGIITSGGNIDLNAANEGNFNTRSTAAAMSLEKRDGGSAIAAAVGVSVNNNKAIVKATKDIIAQGNVRIISSLTQNTSDDFIGKLAIQAVSGSVSGKGTENSVAGAAAILVSHATAVAEIAGKGMNVAGKNVAVIARDKSKLGVRAGGLNISTGASKGMGLSAAVIWSGDTVEAKVADNVTIEADRADISAVKQAITFGDYKFPLKWNDLFTDSSNLSDEERENVYTGLFDIHKKPGETSYTVDINIDTYSLMKVLDALNFLSFTNYYTEAIAGSIIGSGEEQNTLNAAGSFSLVRASNKINAQLGNNVTILKRTKEASEGDGLFVTADGSTNARLIGGAASIGSAGTSAGVTVTFLYDKDNTTATVGDGLTVEARDVSIAAKGDMDVQTFNAAASVNTDKDASFTLGGTVNILLLKALVANKMGTGAKITSDGGLNITSTAEMDLKLISVSLAGARKATAAGGTLAYIDDRTSSTVDIGGNHEMTAVKDVNLAAKTTDRMLSVLASASASLDSEGTAVAGAVSILVSKAKGFTTLGAGGKGVTSSGGNVTIAGETDSRAINVTVGAAGSKGKAIGLAANINVFKRESGVDIKGGDANYKISAAKDLLISTYGNDTSVIAGLAIAGSTGDHAVGGNLPIVVSRNFVTTTLGSGTFSAGGEAAVTSHLKDRTYAIAGSIALSNTKNAVGATVLVAVKKSTVRTDLGTSRITSASNAGTLAGRVAGSPKFKGMYIGATSDNTTVAVAAGVALAGDKGITGNIAVVYSKNALEVDASKASLSTAKGDITVRADNDAYEAVVTGGLNFGKSLGVGAGVIVQVARNEVTTKAHNINAAGDVAVEAKNNDKTLVLNVNAGGSGKTAVELGVTVSDLASRVNAIVASDVYAHDGSFHLTAKNTSDVTNVAVALAGAGKTAVSPVFVYTGYSGENNAIIAAGTVTADKDVKITADSEKRIDQYTVGASFAGATAVSGAVSVVSVKDQTNALTDSSTTVKGSSIAMEAASDYKLVGASAAIAASGTTAAAINALITVMKASTLAEFGGSGTTTEGTLSVQAHSKRDVIDVAATVAASGTNAAGVTLMVLVAGTKMDQDAADTLTYGSGDKEKNKKSFDASAMVDHLDKLGIDTAFMKEEKDKDGNVTRTGMADDLKGDGQHMNTDDIGTKDEKGKRKFDASSGTTDDSLYHGGDGADAKAEETKDLKNAKEVGRSAYTEDPKDAVTARIGNAAVINAMGVSVKADQETLADLFGASVAASGDVAGGLSFTIAKLRSNVIAASLGTIEANGKDVTVQALSRSGEVTPQAGSDEESRMKSTIKALGDKLNPTKRSIRAIGVAAGAAGNVGIGIAAAGVRTDNITAATLGGTVTGAANVNVNSEHKYRDVLAATVAVGAGGSAGISGSIAGVNAVGTVTAKLDRTASITGNKTNVSVTTDSVVNADAVAVAAAGGGGVGAAAGVSYVRNELTQHTTVDRGVQIINTADENGGDLTVTGKSVTTANGLLMGISVGSLALGINVGIANVKPTLNTTLGVNGEGTTTLTKLGNVTVSNDASSTSKASLLAATAGAVGVGANVLLVYNDTIATAKAANVDGSMDNFTIDSVLDAHGVSDSAAVAVGGAAVGANVNYVDVHSWNTSELDATNFNPYIAKALTVRAGDPTGKRTTSTLTQAVTGTAGAIAVSVNVSIARNRAVNDAIINGTDLHANSVKLGAFGKGTAKAEIEGLTVGGISIAASVVNALNETTNRAKMNLTGALMGNLDADSYVEGETNANMETGGGSIVGVKVNVATAYGRTNAITDVKIGKPSGSIPYINATAGGKETVNAKITNLIGLDVLSVATMVGTAHAQDVYSAKVRLANGKYRLSGLSVTTNSEISSNATVTPSSSGVQLSALAIDINQATATSTAYVSSELELEGAEAIMHGKDVTVKTVSANKAAAQIKPATFTWSITVNVGSNQVKADLKGYQAAVLRLNKGIIRDAGAVNVQSLINVANADATVSTSGADEEKEKSKKTRVKLGLVSSDLNTASAFERLESLAAIIGGAGSHIEEYEEEVGGNWVEEFTGEYRKVEAGVVFNPLGKTPTEKYQIVYEDVPIYRQVWKPLTVTKTRLVEDSYKLEDNQVLAKSLLVKSGISKDIIQTAASAFTQGAFQAGLATIGNLDGRAYAVENLNAMFSGAVADITGTLQIEAKGNAKAYGAGTMPGSLSVVDSGSSAMLAGVGMGAGLPDAKPQTVKALIGEGAILKAARINLLANSVGNAASKISSSTSVSLGKVSTSSQPTVSFYDTGIVIADRASLTATGEGDTTNKTPVWWNPGPALNIVSRSTACGESKVNGKNVGIALNVNDMKGANIITDENNIDIGKYVVMKTTNTKGNILVAALTSTRAAAETDMTGGSLFEGTAVLAQNTIQRAARINVGDYADIRSNGGITLQAITGYGDNIYTYSKVETDGGLALGNAKAITRVTSDTQTVVGQGVNIIARDRVYLIAQGGSERGDKDHTEGIKTRAVVKAKGAGINPVATSDVTLTIRSLVSVNRRSSASVARDRTTIRSETSQVDLWSNNEGMRVLLETDADGKAAGGRSLGKIIVTLNLQNTTWVDDANLQAPKSRVLLEAENASAYHPYIILEPYGELYAGAGSVSADIEFHGDSFNQIRSNNTSSVKTQGKFVHNMQYPLDSAAMKKLWVDKLGSRLQGYSTYGANGKNGLNIYVNQKISRGWFLDVDNSERMGLMFINSRCDFCNSGAGRIVNGADRYSVNAFEKALSPLNEIQRQVQRVLGITKARYGDEDYEAARQVHVLDKAVLLGKAITLTAADLEKYRLWTNRETRHDVYLLSNASRLYGSGGNGKIRLQYVTDVIRGDVLGDGNVHEIDIITALTANAFASPIIPIGSTGSLNFRTGMLKLPAEADFELYLNEISGKWVLEQIQAGFLRAMITDPAQANAGALQGRRLPDGRITENLAAGNPVEGLTGFFELNNWKLYWLGDTPETVTDRDQSLILLLVNETTDEIDAYRTSLNMIDNDQKAIGVSFYIYRDSKSDRQEVEKYNIMFFDTPAGEKNLVKIITDVLMGRDLEMPRPLSIPLRAFTLEGADYPAYAISGHFFAMNDGTDGAVSMFGGAYEATLDGNVFESEFIRIEGIQDGNVRTTIKEGQPVWLIRVTDTTATDPEGNEYVWVNEEWIPAENAPVAAGLRTRAE